MIEAEGRAIWSQDPEGHRAFHVQAPYEQWWGWNASTGMTILGDWDQVSHGFEEHFTNWPEPNWYLLANRRFENKTIRIVGDVAWVTFDEVCDTDNLPGYAGPGGCTAIFLLLERRPGRGRSPSPRCSTTSSARRKRRSGRSTGRAACCVETQQPRATFEPGQRHGGRQRAAAHARSRKRPAPAPDDRACHRSPRLPVRRQRRCPDRVRPRRRQSGSRLVDHLEIGQALCRVQRSGASPRPAGDGGTGLRTVSGPAAADDLDRQRPPLPEVAKREAFGSARPAPSSSASTRR